MNQFQKISKEQFHKDIVEPIDKEYAANNCELSPEGWAEVCCNYDEFLLPQRATLSSAAYDLSSRVKKCLMPGETALIPTGVKCQLDSKCFLGLYIRSSMAIKNHLELVNQVGIVDADYYNNEDNEGHILLAIRNFGSEPFTVLPGNRIAQGIIQQYYTTDDEIVPTIPRSGGIGSTGITITTEQLLNNINDGLKTYMTGK